jgi:hypothetical protein
VTSLGQLLPGQASRSRQCAPCDLPAFYLPPTDF